jgi:hypothetical protein
VLRSFWGKTIVEENPNWSGLLVYERKTSWEKYKLVLLSQQRQIEKNFKLYFTAVARIRRDTLQ